MRCNSNTYRCWAVWIFVIALLGRVGRGDVYDVTNDYSRTSASAVNGVWSYGWKLESQLGNSAMTVFNQNLDANGNPLNTWSSTALAPFPFVGKYLSATDSDLNFGAILKANQVVLHAGFSGPNVAVSVVRFTAPESGSYRVDQAVFEYRHDIPGNKVYTYLNGTNIFEQTLGVRGSQASLSPQTFVLNAGDRLDFMVGSRVGGQISRTTTQLNVTLSSISAVPEPSSAILVALSGISCVTRIRKRQRP